MINCRLIKDHPRFSLSLSLNEKWISCNSENFCAFCTESN